MSKSKKVILSALLLSMLIVLSRFLSIKTTFLVISLSFIPMMLSAVYLGPKYSTVIAALGDLIGAVLFPFGPYFPGFTISAGLMGLVYGLLIYKKPDVKMTNWKFVLRLIVSSIIVLGGIKIFLEATFLNILYGKAYMAVVATRVVTESIMVPIQVITIYVLEKALKPFVDKYLYTEIEDESNGN